MWILLSISVALLGTLGVESSLVNGSCPINCICTPLPMKNTTKVNCTDPRPSFRGFPNCTEELIITLGTWSLIRGHISGLASLRYLDISLIRITRLRNDTFVNLPSLQTLVLRKNNLFFMKNDTFKDLPKLEKLDLGFNHGFNYFRAGYFGRLDNLKELLLNDNQILYIEPYAFSELRNLEKLDLSLNPLKTIKEHDFEGLSNLKELSLAGNGMNEFKPGALYYLGKLERLDLSRNGWFISMKAPKLHGLGSLKFLNLSACWLAGIEFKAFYDLKSLQHLDLSDNRLQALDKNSLEGLSALQILDLSENDIAEVEVGTLGDLTNLLELNIGDLPIGYVPENLFRSPFTELRNLVNLRVSFTKATKIPETLFQGMVKLETLSMGMVSSIKHLPPTLFQGLVSLKSVTIPSVGLHCSCALINMLANVEETKVKCQLNLANYTYIDSIACKDINVPPRNPVQPPFPINITDHSFTIKLIEFDEVDGQIRNYDVIVINWHQPTPVNRIDPNIYTNDELKAEKDGLYVAGRITDRSRFGQYFTVGGSSTRRRKKRALSNPRNPKLKPDTGYGVFVRGYVTNELHASSRWYFSDRFGNYIKTTGERKKPEPEPGVDDKKVKEEHGQGEGFAGWKIAVIVISLVIVGVIVMLIALYVKQKNGGFTSTPMPKPYVNPAYSKERDG